MKTKLTLLVLFFAIITTSLFGGENPYLFKWNNYELGGYISFNGRLSKINSDNAGFADVKAALTIDGKYAIGISGSALYYDKKLNKIVNDGTYHLNVGYAGLFFERIFTLNENLKLTASIFTGQGIASYIYDKEYREDKPWYQETIDQETIYIFEPAIDIKAKVLDNFWVGLNGSYRNTSPVKLIDTDEKFLQKFNYGLTFTYGVF